MRIVLDLQGCQSESRFRGIGRCSLAFALALTRQAQNHEVWLALNGALPSAIPNIRESFAGLIPQERIRVFDIPTPAKEINMQNIWRTKSAELIRECFLSSLRPDIVHVSSMFEGFCDESITSCGAFTNELKTSVTLYDLIPLVNPDKVLPIANQKEWYFRKLDSLKNADLFLAISSYAKKEAIDLLKLPEENIVVTLLACDERFAPSTMTDEQKLSLHKQHGITKKAIMYSPGGFDIRKNFENLFKAFALLPTHLRDAHQLVLTSKSDANTVSMLTKWARSAGLRDEELVLTGYVSDEDLVALYSSATLFMFPSWHEGFGLPLLEAMSCGAPCIGSDCTSIPEILPWKDARFNPYDPSDMASRMFQALTDEEYRQSLLERCLEHSKSFSWERCATVALEAFEAHAAKPVATSMPTKSPRRLRLAFVSPLPPEKTGIADYSAELLPALTEYYDIDLIVKQDRVDDLKLSPKLPIRNEPLSYDDLFTYDRILYQVGNSPFHTHMLPSLERAPGICVLHDFYINNIPFVEETRDHVNHAFLKSLYHSHGYASVIDYVNNILLAKETYPTNRKIIDESIGVIVHSNHSKELAQKFYSSSTSQDWAVIPHLAFAKHPLSQAKAKSHLGLHQDDFCVCSFGLIDSTKLNDKLLSAWLSSSLANDLHCKLIFVGGMHGGEYGKRLQQIKQNCDIKAEIIFTNYISIDTFNTWLCAADIAVQLRTMSRGESSGSILRCLSQGVPLIYNAHGSAAELPESIAFRLNDNLSEHELIDALETLHKDSRLRASFSKNGDKYYKDKCSLLNIAKMYYEAIENFYHTSQAAKEFSLICKISQINKHDAVESDLKSSAKCIANISYKNFKQLFIDISSIIKHDLKTGIERVTINYLSEIIKTPLSGYRAEPVYMKNNTYYYARSFTLLLLGASEDALNDEPVEVYTGDIFLGLDFAPETCNLKSFYSRLQELGINTFFLVHDILPVLHQEWFPPCNSPSLFQQWLEHICLLSSKVICVSQTTANDIEEWININLPAKNCSSRTAVNYSCVGFPSIQENELTSDIFSLFESFKNDFVFLMVGTIEPRKGYLQTLDAFSLLWSEGSSAKLLIIGREGWKPLPDNMRRTIPTIVERLNNHPELNKNLFWLNNADDNCLVHAYSSSSALLAASEGEGFGLPLIEAAHFNLPIIARDIPIFREVIGDYAHYFNGPSAEDLADAIKKWIANPALNKTIKGKIPTVTTWEESSERLLKLILPPEAFGTTA